MEKSKFSDFQRPSVRLEWHDLRYTASEKLSALLDRKIEAEPQREIFYCWGLKLSETPLNKTEIEKLLSDFNASDFDRESNNFGVYPLTEISKGLAEKILSPELPFPIELSHADEEGVWFFGPTEDRILNIAAHPETDKSPDYFRIYAMNGEDKEKVLSIFDEAQNNIEENGKDRDKHLDNILKRIEKTGCRVDYYLPALYEFTIN